MISKNDHDEEKNKHTRISGNFPTSLLWGRVGGGVPPLDFLVLDVWCRE